MKPSVTSSVVGKKLLVSFLLCSIVLLGASRRQSRTFDPALVTGLIFDSGSLRPLASVEVQAGSAKTHSGPDGKYQIKVEGGIRKITYRFANKPPVTKIVFVRDSSAISIDTVFPAAGNPSKRLLTFRGLALTQNGDTLKSDLSTQSAIMFVDEWGNFLSAPPLSQPDLRQPKAHKTDLFYVVKAYTHDAKSKALNGLYKSSNNADGKSVIASKEIDAYEVLSNGSFVYAEKSAVRLVESGKERVLLTLPAKAFVESLCALNDTLAVGVMEEIKLSQTRSTRKGRIALVNLTKPSDPSWISHPDTSLRYPECGVSEGNIVYTRLSLDGKSQKLHRYHLNSAKDSEWFSGALRAVANDQPSRIYFISNNQLVLRIPDAPDLRLLNSVQSASLR